MSSNALVPADGAKNILEQLYQVAQALEVGNAGLEEEIAEGKGHLAERQKTHAAAMKGFNERIAVLQARHDALVTLSKEIKADFAPGEVLSRGEGRVKVSLADYAKALHKVVGIAQEHQHRPGPGFKTTETHN